MLSFKAKKAFLKVGERSLGLDTKGDVSFISHAHSDHIPNTHGQVICDDATADIIRAKGDKTISERTSLDGVTLLNSGHVLGGKQLFFEKDGQSLLYSGDIKTQDSLTLSGAQTKHADKLIIECTYGLPQYVFPEREETYAEIASWATGQQKNNNIGIIGGYSVGKAQEIIKILNTRASITPVVNAEISRVCEAYEKHGIRLDYINSESEEGKEQLRHTFTSVLPMHKVRQQLVSNLQAFYNRKVSASLATGWSLYSKSSFKSFCLSDHADFKDLLGFVERVDPKKTYCTHGFAEEFSATLKSRGYDASVAKEAEQKLLTSTC